MDEHHIGDIVIEITDVDKKSKQQPRCSEHDNEFLERPRLPIAAKLIALWNLLFELVVGVPYIFLMLWVGDDFSMEAVVICGFLFAIVHTAASACSFGRYNRKYGVSEWKFVLLNVLPLLFILCSVWGVLWFLVSVLKVGLTFSIGFVILMLVFTVCFAGYSVVYGVFLSMSLGVRFAVCRKR